MVRVKLLVALVGLMALGSVGCSNATSATSAPAKSTTDGKDKAPAAADGSGSK